ncbi:stalk domain-containing protein [Paenibacillus sp. sgz500958]|uniref:stalk domain-containing protein n=1 Tax=Paenibacillus sp. sgz500958 TaxID=3242475 RepID=UPI0036D2A0DC
MRIRYGQYRIKAVMLAATVVTILFVYWGGTSNRSYAEEAVDTYSYPPARTEEQLRNYWGRSTPGNVSSIFKKKAVYSPAYIPAEVDPVYYEYGLKILNYWRYAAGIDKEVTLDPGELSKKAQLSADLQVINGGSRVGPKPAAMSEAEYKEAQRLTGDVFLISLPGVHKLDTSFFSWFIQRDLHSFNLLADRIGLLGPELTKIGFGLGEINNERATLTGKTDINPYTMGTAGYDVVPVPGKGVFPAEQFNPDNPWRIMLSRNTFNITSTDQVTVSLERTNDNRKWTLTKEDKILTSRSVIDSGALLKVSALPRYYLIQFRPGQVHSYNGGDEYTVQINGVQNSGGSSTVIRYKVRFANTGSMERTFPELPYDNFGHAVMLREVGTNKPVSGVKTDIYRLVIPAEGSGIAVKEPVLYATETSSANGVIVIADQAPALYNFQILSRIYAPEMTFMAEVKEGQTNITFTNMLKLAGWGKALDSSGQPIEGLGIEVKDSKGTIKRVMTNRLGEYGFADLAIGETYNIGVYMKPQGYSGVMANNVSFVYNGSYSMFPSLRIRTSKLPITGKPGVVVNGIPLATSSKQPIAVLNAEGNLLIQIKALNNALKEPFSIKYVNNLLTLTNSKVYTMMAGSKLYSNNGVKKDMGAKLQVINGTVYIPLFFIAEALDYFIEIEASKNLIRLTSIEL